MQDSSTQSTNQQAITVVARMMTAAIQRMLKYDPQSVKKLKPYAQKKVKINIQPINQSVVLLIQEATIEVSTDNDIAVDTTISGKPSALFAMSTNQHIPGLDGVTINGDATTGQFMADFLKQLKPDWEDAWCDLLGEGPGFQVSELFKSVAEAGIGLFNSVVQSSQEYLLEENRELISPHEMDEFLDQVADLQSDTVRLERKLAELKDQIEP